ncbi:hypothetical protein [Sulfitobacter sp. NAS-14.1]|uniref:hypothetical protein n=1 Tax=Sulfitobacter TaxID=60136 RepID=UPI000066B298|nr:hypothetical protein [Sulfitobacter sp. NAS-14.1]EAP79238.1 hypothetical protein NAS141_19249 [Sulfitobacter sp. NAS-14.1]
MAQSVIGALRVNLGLDSAKFSRGLTEAQKSMQAARKQFAAVAGVAAAMGAAISAAALAGARDIDRAAKSARRLDSTVGAFRALELAAGEAGVSLSGLANDVQTMNRELANVGKTGNAKRALDALGLSAGELQGLDADEKLATIADQVKKLGLDAGQTTAVLRDLGIRNREMALLVLGGGEAIRAARGDIKEYGLELNSIQSAGIERANDQIGRLGLITQYAGQQLALTLVPAMGQLAEALTNSLREGGALRAVIDGLIGNLDRLATYVAVAVAGFGVKYVGAMAMAALSTASLSKALMFMRGALIRTGIGALVVGAGELVYQFARLVKASGGWGNALSALGDLAAGVWQGIQTSASAIPPALAAVWKMVASSFYGMMSELQESWSRFLGNLGANLSDVPGMGKFADAILETSGKAAAGMSEFDAKAQAAANSAAVLKDEASALAAEGFQQAKDAAAKLAAIVSNTADETDGGAAATENLNDALEDLGGSTGSGGSAGKAAKALDKVKTEAEAYQDALKEAANTSEDIGTEKARILVGGIDSIANAFGDFIGGGLKGFKGFTKSILDGFKGMISQMIALAAKNQIMFSLGIAPAGVGGAAAAGVPGIAGMPSAGGILGSLGSLGGGAGGGGLLGGITSGLGALTSGLGAGFNMALGGFASGGLGGLGSVISTQLGAATASVGALGAAVGAIALPVAAVAAVFSFFKKKTKELDAGLRVTIDGLDGLVETFKVIETKRFWGLSKKVRTSYQAAADETAKPLLSAIDSIAQSVIGLGDVFGFASANIDKASFQFKISTKGKSDEEIQEAIAEELDRLGDVFADSIVGTFDEVVTKVTGNGNLTGLAALFSKSGGVVTETISHVNEEFEALKKEGEGSFEALSRLVSSLTSVNAVMDTLGGTLYEVSLAGADMASGLVDMFGGLDAIQSATSAYYQAFYTEQERLDTLTRQLTGTLSDLGQTMPETRAQFRALVEAQDLTTEAGRAMFAALVSLAGQFDSILPALDSLSNKLGDLVADAIDSALAPIDAQIEASSAAANQARQSATEFYRLAESLRSTASSIGGVQSASDLAGASQRFASLFAQAIGGDLDALGDLGGAGSALASDSAGFAKTATELRRIEAGISSQLGQAAAVSEALGLGADYQAMLFDVQTAALQETRALLTQGDITQEIMLEQAALLENIGRQIVNSTDLQVAVNRDASGKALAALVDNAGAIVGSLSAEGAKGIAALQGQTANVNAATAAAALGLSSSIVSSLDGNSDGIISAQEMQAASIVSAYQSTVISLASAIDRNGAMTTAQIRASLAGKASDAAISAVISAVDRNKDGVVSAEEIAAARMLSGINQGTLEQVRAMAGQNGVFANAITGQTASVTGSQSLTNAELGKVQDLQGETVSITELVERAVAGNENLTSALLNRMASGISVAGVPSMVSGLNSIGSLIGRIVAVQEASLAAAEAEAARQEALTNAQRELEATALAQGSAIEQVSAASTEIFSLASRFGVYLNAQSGPVQLSQTAKFGVNDQGLFDAQYNQISFSGSSSKARNFKNEFYGEGGLYGQTYGRAAELKALAEQLQAQRQAVIDLGGIPQFARGGRHFGGLRIVGENGPELEYTGASQIYNARQTRDLLAGAGGDPAHAEDLRRLLLEVVKNTKRSSDIARKHDVDGMPPVRV